MTSRQSRPRTGSRGTSRAASRIDPGAGSRAGLRAASRAGPGRGPGRASLGARSPLGARLRKALAAVLAATAVGGAVHLAVNRPSPDSVPVVVAGRSVGPGAALDGVVELRHLPPAALPEGALTSLDQATGRVASSMLSPGEVLTPPDVRLAEVLGDPAPERVVFLPITEAAVLAAVTAGDSVDVHSPVDGRVVIEAVPVVAVHPGTEGGAWLAADPEQSTALAAARGADPAGGSLLIALHPPARP